MFVPFDSLFGLSFFEAVTVAMIGSSVAYLLYLGTQPASKGSHHETT